MAEPELIGRAVELDTASVCLAEAEAGRARVLVVRGDAGVGKTAFIDEVVRQHAKLFRTIRLDGHPAEADLPYAGLHQFVRLARGVGGKSEDAGNSRNGDANDALFSLGGTRLESASRLLDYIAGISSSNPLLLVIDNAQWLDRLSRQAFIFVARRLEMEPVCILFSTRQSESEFANPSAEPADLSAEFANLGTEIDLSPLTPKAAALLVRSRAPGTSALVVERIVKHASGVPLMLVETIAALSEKQRLGVLALPQELPVAASLDRILSARLHRLADRERLAVLALSFEPLNREAREAVFAKLGFNSPADITVALDAAERAGLVDLHDDDPRFTHPNIPGALRRHARRPELQAIHAVLADHFAGEPLNRVRHIQHLDAYPRADRYAALVEAAHAATEQHGYALAGELLERAAEYAETPSAGTELLRQAGDAYVQAGMMTAAEGLFANLVERVESDVERAELSTRRMFVSMWSRGVPPSDSAEMLQLGLQLVNSAVADERAAGEGLITGLAITAVGAARYVEAHRICQQFAAVVTGTMSIDQALIADVAAVMVGAEGAGAVLRADWVDDYPWERLASGMTPIPFVTLTLERLGAHRLLDRVMRAHAERSGEWGRVAGNLYLQRSIAAITAQSRGQWHRAAREFEALKRFITETDSAGPFPFVSLQYAELLGLRGDRSGSQAQRAEARAGTAVWTPMMEHLDRYVEGRTLLVHREYEAALTCFAQMRAIEAAEGLGHSGYLPSLPDAIEAAWHLGRATELTGDLARYEELVGAAEHGLLIALSTRSRALLTLSEGHSHEPPDTLFERAIEQLLESEDPPNSGNHRFEVARTRLLYGQVLRRARRKSDAVAQLELAEQVFAELGAVPLFEVCRSELVACGKRRVEVEAPQGSAIAKLTPREYEVSREVAAGASNAEAASRLFISERTVEFHLTAVFRKLGVSGREELRNALQHS